MDNGTEQFNDEQLLEALLFYSIPRKDTVPAARLLLNKFGNLCDILRATPESLKEIDGIGENCAAYIKLLNTLILRCDNKRDNSKCTNKRQKLVTANDAALYLKNLFCDNRIEQVFMVCLNSEYEALGNLKLGQGTAYSARLNLKDIARHALNTDASKILLAHNHTTGGAAPGKADIDTTKAVIKALEQFGITVADHIIITQDEYFSFLNNGLLNQEQ